MNYRSGGPRSFNTVKRSNREERRKRLRQCEKTLFAIVIAFALLLVSAFVLLVCNVAVDIQSRRASHEENTLDTPKLPEITYEMITRKSRTDCQAGELVVVNKHHEYLFPRSDADKLVNLVGGLSADGKASYRIKDSQNARLQSEAAEQLDALLNQYYNQTGTSLMVLHTYRSKADQESVSVNSGVAPGFSEHHTGLLVALSQGSDFTSDFAEQEQRLFEICHQYGFIQRYPEGKSGLTGVTDYGECLRYVGVAHATYIYNNGLCLEEYVEMLRRNHVSTNGTDGKHLAIDTNKDGTADYAVYYVPKNESSDLTAIPVPKGEGISYTVSGDNIGGFIVTVTLRS